MTELCQTPVSTHNQYLETTMAIGIPGLCLMLLFMFSGIWTGLRDKKFVLVCMLVVVMVNMLFESMFETQAGVVFIVYFISMLAGQPSPGDKGHT